MTLVITTAIRCDGPGCKRETIGTNGSSVMEEAELERVCRLGWKISAKWKVTSAGHLCPDCALKERT